MARDAAALTYLFTSIFITFLPQFRDIAEVVIKKEINLAKFGYKYMKKKD
jgi:hypothetical protein